jgi:hypothetical protein
MSIFVGRVQWQWWLYFVAIGMLPCCSLKPASESPQSGARLEVLCILKHPVKLPGGAI